MFPFLFALAAAATEPLVETPAPRSPLVQTADPARTAEPDAQRDSEIREDEPVRPRPIRRQLVRESHEVRPLPGGLDDVLVFNSNSPEVVRTEGILLSTFPPNGMRVPSAHLNYAFEGRFDVFSHHISRASAEEEGRTLFQGVMVYNPGPNRVRVSVMEAASYLSRFDAPFRPLPAYVEDPLGTVYSGSGSRVVSDILRGRRRGNWRTAIELAPRQADMLLNVPIPVGKVTPSSNTRSTLIRLNSSGPVYLASMAMFSPKTPDGREQIPTLRQWQILLVNSGLSGPRDVRPTPPDLNPERFFYGRVAGVARGSRWEATLTDPGSDRLRVRPPGEAVSYGVAMLPRGTFGTGQVQSAPLVARYPDTAYRAHGNYGVHYSLTLPLTNDTGRSQRVAILMQTPLKEDRASGQLQFLEPPEDRVFFRGPLRLTYPDETGREQTRYVHVVQHRGEQGKPLLVMPIPPGAERTVKVDFLYPPDATPPQVLTVRTLP